MQMGIFQRYERKRKLWYQGLAWCSSCGSKVKDETEREGLKPLAYRHYQLKQVKTWSSRGDYYWNGFTEVCYIGVCSPYVP